MSEVLTELKIHPAADLFPMMAPDELAELASDIAENGQQEPIIVDGDILIDGRNRLAACKLVGIEPFFADLPRGRDPLGYIASANLMRRNLTKGQQAMAMAMIYPEPEKGGRGKKKKVEQSSTLFSEKRLQQARTVLHHSRSLAESVIKGIMPLNDALETVKKEQEFQQSDEEKLTRLLQSAPDLAEQVGEERLKIDEAIAALKVREQELRRIAEDGQRAAQEIVRSFPANVSAIVSAVGIGEKNLLSAEHLEHIRASYDLLVQYMSGGKGDGEEEG
jgi:hypothetical protein